MDQVRIATAVCVHDDHWFLKDSLESFAEAGPAFVFVSSLPWHGEAGDWERAASAATEAGAEVVLGEWPAEILHRQGARQWLIDRGFTHAFMPDSDELIDPELLKSIKAAGEARLAQRFYVEMDTYWKSPDVIIRPREVFRPMIFMELSEVWPDDQTKFSGRLYGGGKALMFGADHGVLHHLSYVGPDERIKRKTESWSHFDEVVPHWWENVWLAWDQNPLLRDLHPTHPTAYGFTERIHRPEVLANVTDHRPKTEISVPNSWPSVSIVIPLYGGPGDITRCLESLQGCRDLLHETLVVDNASLDSAAKAVERFEFVKLIQNDSNLGFGAACNQGAETTSGDIVLFLNSDTIVPRAGLIRLIESVTASGSIGAAGPLTNRSGHLQQIQSTYTSRETIEFFADDFARMPSPDVEVDMLVGFCLAVRRSVFTEIGGFDPRFGLGMFEDNDLSYRIRRAGYKLVLSARSFVHHEGSKSVHRLADPVGLFNRNLATYRKKWAADLESGFADRLSGIGPATKEGRPVKIRFTPERQPERIREQAAQLATRAHISLCMIVKDEERVLAECLESARPYFSEVIVVDTGSTDRTKAIAEEYASKVIDSPWKESFSEARNVSISHATGDWIFWLDADDTVPIRTGMAILDFVLKASKDTLGFVVPVQFVEEGPSGGTRVDHLKLFRNLPGLEFEGRIHEQILESLRKHPVRILRIDEPIMHSGYDVSPEGQAKKRERDMRLLALDLKERPDHPFVLFNMGMTEHHAGLHEEAIAWLDKSLEKSAVGETFRRKAYALKVLSQRALGNLDGAKETVLKGLGELDQDSELRFLHGLILTETKHFAESLEQYLMVPELDPNVFYSVDLGLLTFKKHHNIGTVYYSLGDYKNASENWRKALQISPAFLRSAFSLFDAELSQGDYMAAREMLDYVHAVQGWSESWADMLANFEQRWHGPTAALQRLQDAVAQNPQEIGPRLILSRRLLAANLVQPAIPHLQVLASAGIAEGAYCLGIADLNAGRLPEAMDWLCIALKLNPEHEETQRQISAIRLLLGES